MKILNDNERNFWTLFENLSYEIERLENIRDYGVEAKDYNGQLIDPDQDHYLSEQQTQLLEFYNKLFDLYTKEPIYTVCLTKLGKLPMHDS